jgi:hypothetical protein
LEILNNLLVKAIVFIRSCGRQKRLLLATSGVHVIRAPNQLIWNRKKPDEQQTKAPASEGRSNFVKKSLSRV